MFGNVGHRNVSESFFLGHGHLLRFPSSVAPSTLINRCVLDRSTFTAESTAVLDERFRSMICASTSSYLGNNFDCAAAQHAYLKRTIFGK